MVVARNEFPTLVVGLGLELGPPLLENVVTYYLHDFRHLSRGRVCTCWFLVNGFRLSDRPPSGFLVQLELVPLPERDSTYTHGLADALLTMAWQRANVQRQPEPQSSEGQPGCPDLINIVIERK